MKVNNEIRAYIRNEINAKFKDKMIDIDNKKSDERRYLYDNAESIAYHINKILESCHGEVVKLFDKYSLDHDGIKYVVPTVHSYMIRNNVMSVKQMQYEREAHELEARREKIINDTCLRASIDFKCYDDLANYIEHISE